MKHPNRLAAKVAAVNRAHAEANRLQKLFIEALRPFVGKKVLVTGGLAHKVKAALANISLGSGFRFWRNSNFIYTLSWSLCCGEYVEGDAGHQSAEATFNVGDLQRHDGNGGMGFGPTDILEKVLEPQTLPTNYTVKRIIKAREKMKVTKDAYDKARGWDNIGPFGEHDNF